MKSNFGSAIREYAKAHKMDMKELTTDVFYKMSEPIVRQSPAYDIKGGRFRSNWFAKVGSRSRKTTTARDRNSMDGVEDVARSAFDSGTTMHLTNNLPYARVIEYGLYPNPPRNGRGRTRGGYSTQAHGGLVRLTILRMKRDFFKIAKSDRMRTGGSARRVWTNSK